MSEMEEMYQPPKKSWWGRNWVWVVPVGCFTPFLVCGGCITLIYMTVPQIRQAVLDALSDMTKASEVYRDALAKAKESKAVQDALGIPIQEGALVMGTVNMNGQVGTANFSVPLSGPKGSGTLYVVAQKTAGTWTFSTLEFAVQGGNRIKLLPTADPGVDKKKVAPGPQ